VGKRELQEKGGNAGYGRRLQGHGVTEYVPRAPKRAMNKSAAQLRLCRHCGGGDRRSARRQSLGVPAV